MALELRQAVMPSVRKALEILRERVEVAGAILFGSHVEGEPGPYSDIDLGVFVEGAERWDLIERVDLATWVQLRAGHRVDLHFFGASELSNPEPGSFAAYVIEHGKAVD